MKGSQTQSWWPRELSPLHRHLKPTLHTPQNSLHRRRVTVCLPDHTELFSKWRVCVRTQHKPKCPCLRHLLRLTQVLWQFKTRQPSFRPLVSPPVWSIEEGWGHQGGKGRLLKMSRDSSVVFSSFPTLSYGHSLTCCVRRWSPREVKVAVLPNSMKTLLCSLTSLYSHPYGNPEYFHGKSGSRGAGLGRAV